MNKFTDAEPSKFRILIKKVQLPDEIQLASHLSSTPEAIAKSQPPEANSIKKETAKKKSKQIICLSDDSSPQNMEQPLPIAKKEQKRHDYQNKLQMDLGLPICQTKYPTNLVINQLIRFSRLYPTKMVLQQIAFESEKNKISPMDFLLFFGIELVLCGICVRANKYFQAMNFDLMKDCLQATLIQFMKDYQKLERPFLDRIVNSAFTRFGCAGSYCKSWLTSIIKNNQKELQRAGYNIEKLLKFSISLLQQNAEIFMDIERPTDSLFPSRLSDLPEYTIYHNALAKRMKNPELYQDDEIFYINVQCMRQEMNSNYSEQQGIAADYLPSKKKSRRAQSSREPVRNTVSTLSQGAAKRKKAIRRIQRTINTVGRSFENKNEYRRIVMGIAQKIYHQTIGRSRPDDQQNLMLFGEIETTNRLLKGLERKVSLKCKTDQNASNRKPNQVSVESYIEKILVDPSTKEYLLNFWKNQLKQE